MNVGVVGATGNRNEVIRISLDALRAHRVASDHHVQVVALEEGVQVVGSKIDDVVLLLGVTVEVVCESVLLFSLVGVAPKKINHLLLVLRVVTAQLDLKRSWNGLNALDVLNRWSNTSMDTQNLLLLVVNDGGQWHLIEGVIEFGKDTIWVVDVLTESLGAFVSQAEVLVDMAILMVASQQNDLLREFELQDEEEADDLKTPLALINVVAQEHVIEGMDVALVDWSLPDIEETHQIDVLTVNVADDFGGWADLLDDNWLGCQDIRHLVDQL